MTLSDQKSYLRWVYEDSCSDIKMKILPLQVVPATQAGESPDHCDVCWQYLCAFPYKVKPESQLYNTVLSTDKPFVVVKPPCDKGDNVTQSVMEQLNIPLGITHSVSMIIFYLQCTHAIINAKS